MTLGSDFFELDCDDDVIRMEVTEEGEIIFHDFDPEAEEASVELGFEPSEAFMVWKIIGLALLEEESELLDDALNNACRDGAASVVEAFIAVGADPFNNGNCPLNSAAVNGHANIVELLLDFGVSPFISEVVIWHILEHGHTDVVKVLLPAGAFDSQYANALRLARRHGHTDIVEMLKQRIGAHGR
jgi:hypothetical protein